MSGLTQIKDQDNFIYDALYDEDLKMFMVFEHEKETADGVYFSSESINKYIKEGQIEVYKDGNGIFKKYL